MVKRPSAAGQPDEGVYYAKGEYDNAVEYNNELICLSNYGLDQMAKMNDAMDAKDYNRAEWVRLEWIEDLKGLREQAAALGAYDGDDRMLKALYKSLRWLGSSDEGWLQDPHQDAS